MLIEYLRKDRILLNFKAADFKQALKKMIAVSSERKRSHIINDIMRREVLMSTMLGKGVALPRITTERREKTEIIIAVSRNGINIKSFDLRPVKIIVLFLFSENDDLASILAQSLRLLNEDSLRTEILNSKREDEIIATIKKWEEEDYY